MANDFTKSDEYLQLKDAKEKIERPDKFAELFCQAAKTQTAVKDLLKELLQEVMATDPKARESLNGLIKEVFQQDWRSFVRSTWGKFALVAWTIISAILGALIKDFF